MDHQEKHHLQHQKEREHEKKLHKAHEHAEEKKVGSIHPAWFMAIGIVLIGLVILLWTMF